ncbi:MAG: LysM peptidoglycan-binding domain-containing protein [Chloroflexi bacterium]|nr:LysM peptidoglycan-binding domain-containing protein [Chloroflexota bacterium]
MKRLSALIFIVVLCLVLNVFYGHPQTAENLLTNPGFEEAFVEQDGESPQNVATGWTAWHIPRTDSSPAYANHAPFYNEETVRTRGDEPGKAQVYFNQYATHQGGIYQQVDDLTAGADYRFSIYAWVWSSIGQDWDISEQPGNVSVRVGIDPSGGTDGASENIVWSTTAVFLYNAYYQYSVIAAAESATITVFVESTVGEPVANNYIYLEDAVLEVATQNVIVVDSTPTSETNDELAGESEDEATPTLEPTSTPTSTQDVAATEEPTATQDPSAADEPTATEIPPSDTPVPTDTAEPTATEESTATDDPPDDTAIAEPYTDTVTHTVVENDTISAIAFQYGSTEEAIKDANGLTNSLIVVGQQLIVPINLPNPTETPLPPDQPTPTETPIPPSDTPTPTATPIPTATPVVYIVQTGDTLLGIAVANGTTVEALIQLNGIQNPDQLAVGLVLLIPTPEPTPLPTATPQILLTAASGASSTSYTTYTVQVGDTLDEIATQFSTTIAAIVQLNAISNPSRIDPGQVLRIPAAPGEGTPIGDPQDATATATTVPSPTPIPTSAPTTYTVQAGDTLFEIAQRFGVSVVELGTYNNIVDYNAVYPGQVLIIPG